MVININTTNNFVMMEKNLNSKDLIKLNRLIYT